MSTDERLLRLENAFASLAELTANAQELAINAQELAARSQELAARAQEKDARQDARLYDLAESNRLLVEMIRRHDERIDDLRGAQREAHEELSHKIAALADAQIRAEDEMRQLRAALAELAERFDVLRDIVQRGRDGQASA